MDNVSVIAEMVREAEKHADNLSKDRIRAVEYYQGVMNDTKSDKGRSAMVSRDVRAVIKKVLPSLMRTILGNDNVVEYQPSGQNDEEGAQQASDYVNNIVMPECDGYRAVEDAIHDALLLRNGILKWWFEEKLTATVTSHTGLNEDAFAQLVNAPDVEVLEHSENVEHTDQGDVPVHDVKIKRIIKARDIKAAAVPRERFLIHPDAVTLHDSVITGEKTQMRRSDLVAMGYEKDKIFTLPVGDEDDYESDVRRDFVGDSDEATRANELVDYYDIYVRIDTDGDGISELRHMCLAGGLGEKNLLLDEETDEVQMCDIKVMAQPHQWEGISIFDDVADIQRVKTVLLRQTLDNLYWQNNPQATLQDGALTPSGLDAVFNPEFGKPISVRQGVDVRAAYGFMSVPFVAQQSFDMLAYMDREAEDRTGVTDASSGLAPDAMQNMTAKASAMIEQAGIGQTELMVRTAAEGLRRFFRGILKLVIKHQDIPRTVRLRDEWVQFDPRSWNSDMDCHVNTGLGAGTRERDMMMMQMVMATQEKLLAAFGAGNNPYVTPDNLYNALEKQIESAGLKTPGLYFTKPDPEAIKQRLEAEASKPDPETMKMQAQMQLEHGKAQMHMELEKARMQAARDKEMAQMQADIEVKRAEAEKASVIEQQRMQFEAAKQDKQLELERQKLASQREIELLKLSMSEQQANAPIQAEDQRMELMREAIGMLGQELQTLRSEMAQPRTKTVTGPSGKVYTVQIH